MRPATAPMKQDRNYSRFFSAFPAPVPLYLDGVTLKRYCKENINTPPPSFLIERRLFFYETLW